jgi:hypothetical protein
MRVFLCLLLLASSVQAEPNPAASNPMASAHTLPPEKLEAIRLIGRNVLQAKNVKEEPLKKEQLLQLNATLDKLITTESSALKPGSIALLGKTPTITSSQQATVATAQTTAHTQAWDVVAKLHQDAGHLQRQKNKPAKVEVYSAGFPVGEQHGRLYEDWANKLESILTNNNTNRLSQLIALREEINGNKAVVINAPLAQKTPTIQAMPWEPPVAPIKKTHLKNKSTH